MSTKVHDFAAQVHYATSVVPAAHTSSATGSAIDMLAADGRGFAVLQVGAVGGGTTIAARIEHSPDQSVWESVPGGTFPNVVAGPATHALGFDRVHRYIRAVAELTGGSPSASLCIGVGQQKKTI